MIKNQELNNLDSCFNKAHDSERIFILLGRDEAAPAAIRAWCNARMRTGKNKWDDPQIREAMREADFMDQEQTEARRLAAGVVSAY